MENNKGFADKYFLEKIYLSGYKSIRQTEIELKNNFNIIIGKNGAGKTNFLSFLSRVLNDDFNELPKFEAVLTFTGKNQIEIKTEKKPPVYSPERNLTPLGINNNIFYEVSVNRAPHKNYKIGDYSLLNDVLQDSLGLKRSGTFIKHGVPSDYDFVTKPIELKIKDDEWLESVIEKISIKEPYLVNIFYYSFAFQRNRIRWIFKNNKSEEEIYQHLTDFLHDKIIGIKNYLSELTPITDIRFFNFRIDEKKELREFTFSNLLIKFQVDGEWYFFSDLSDGTKRLFYIISEVASPDSHYFRSPDFEGRIASSNSRIILIEEPELGIHPHQLHKLMTFLKEQSLTKQIIITTHSPEVLNILGADELDSIILSEYDKEKGTLLRHMTDKEKMDAKSYIKDMFLSDYWMHSNLEPTN